MKRLLSDHAAPFILSSLFGVMGGAAAGLTIVVISVIYAVLFAHGQSDLFTAIGVSIYGALCGAIAGAFVVPMAYILLLHRTGFEIAVIPAFVGTVGFALIAALADPDSILGFGIVGFFASLYATYWLDRTANPVPVERDQNAIDDD